MSFAASLEILKGIFSDHPDALNIFTLENLEAEGYKEHFRNNSEIFASPINMYVTGRTGAGKTALGNCLLSEASVMSSTGFQDCTKEIGWFKLASNLCYFDLPGIASGAKFENINRAALLMPQIDDEFADPPVMPLEATDTVEVFDFSNCVNPKDKPEEELVKVGDWQHPENQKNVEPDVIIYVLAPDKQFLGADKKYLGELLKTWKQRKKRCIVITALNIFERNGKAIATPQQMEYARTEIPKVYQAVFKTEPIPPIIEINSLTGRGIGELTDIVCQVIPQEKIGNMQQALRAELKQYAEKERTKRYYRTLSLIAGRLSRYTVDKKLEGQNLLQAAASAISAYGVMTFKNADDLAEIRDQIDVITEQVEQVERAQQKDITEKENVMDKKDITRVKPKTEQVEVEDVTWRPETRTDTVEEEVYVPVTKTKSLKKTVLVPGKIKEKKERSEWGKFWTGEDYYTEETDGYVEKTVNEEVLFTESDKKTVKRNIEKVEWVKETKKRLETKITGYEEEIVDTVEVVVAQVDKVVGTEYLSGGYPAIKLLLGLGLGVQSYCTNQTSIQQGELMAERKLAPFKSKIEELVNDSEGEQELVEILERALVN
ncbi:MAG: GTPase [Cyclobacteriaceae bacterium]